VKWVYLLGVVFLAPALLGLLRTNRRYLVPTCFVLGVTMLLLGPSLWTAVVGWPAWPAPVKGAEVSFVDSIAFALFFSAPKVRIPVPIKLSYAIICLALLISTFLAYNKIASLFYVWELLRATLLFLAIARVCTSEPRAAIALFAGLCIGLMGEAAWTVAQYAQGLERPGGSFGHSNTLGIAADFVVFPALALMLGGRRWLLSVAAVFAGGVCALAGGSRASMGLFAVGVLLTTMLSIARKSTSRKFAFGGGMSVLLLLSIPAMIWSANRRSEMATEMSDQARTSMKDAAKMMIADHPFGVGANQYVVVSNMGGYAARAGVAWGGTTRAAPVHDTYYLVTAELGFIGLIGLLAMFASAIGLGFASLRRNLTDESSELVPGLLGAIIIVSLHVAYEFAFMEFMLHYLFAISIAILVAVSARAKSPARNAAGVMVRSGPVTAVG
jgi:hypothetical protein